MRPKTISASSLQDAQDCLALYHAKHFERVPESGKKEPAKRGTTVHYALQHFVKAVCIDKTASWDDKKLLRKLYDEGYVLTFATCDRTTSWYQSGWKMVLRWHARTDLSDVEVLSVEEKRRTPVPSARYDRRKPAAQQSKTSGIVPLTYIWDRCDRYIHPITGNRVIRIVDYKSQNRPISAEKLKNKLQAKIYACAAMTYFKDERPDQIRIQFDFLQYEPIEISYTPEECVRIWVDLRRELQRIMDIPAARRLPRQLGAHCKYCPIAFSCDEVRKNIDGGGIHSLDTAGQASLRAELEGRKEALGALIAQLDEHLIAEANELDMTEFVAGEHTVRLKLGSRRIIDQALALKIMGPDLYVQYAPLTVEKWEELMRSDEVDVEQKKLMKGVIEKRTTERLQVVVEKDEEAGE